MSNNIYEDLVRTMNIDTETPYLAELSGTDDDGMYHTNSGAVVFSLDTGRLEYTFTPSPDDAWFPGGHKLLQAPDLRLAVPSMEFDEPVHTVLWPNMDDPTKGVVSLKCFGDASADLAFIRIKFKNLPDGWNTDDDAFRITTFLDHWPVLDETGNISLSRYGWERTPAIKLEWRSGRGETWTVNLRRIPLEQRNSDHNFQCQITVDGARLTGGIAQEFLNENLGPFLQFTFAGRADNYVAVGYDTLNTPTWGVQIRDTTVDIPENSPSRNWFLLPRSGAIALSPQFQAFCDLDTQTKKRYQRVIEAYTYSEQVYALGGSLAAAASLSYAALDSLARIIAATYPDHRDWLTKNLEVKRGKYLNQIIDLVAERELNEVEGFKRAARAVTKTQHNMFHADPTKESPDWRESWHQWVNTQTMVEILLLKRLGMQEIPVRASVPTVRINGIDMLAEERQSSIAGWFAPPGEADETNEGGESVVPKISKSALREVRRAFAQYEREVEQADLVPDTKSTYLYHSRSFVRWLNDDFTPGGRRR